MLSLEVIARQVAPTPVVTVKMGAGVALVYLVNYERGDAPRSFVKQDIKIATFQLQDDNSVKTVQHVWGRVITQEPGMYSLIVKETDVDYIIGCIKKGFSTGGYKLGSTEYAKVDN